MNIQEYQKPIYEKSDEEFDSIYPIKIQKLSSRHWTPVGVAKKVADYLVVYPSTKVLDIGSGAGKFCLVAASYSKGEFTGVQQRASLIRLAKKCAQKLLIKHVKFIQADIRSVDFREYDSFYFFNSFEENLDLSDHIDLEISLNSALFEDYTRFVRDQLENAPLGTRIATYCTSSYEIPSSYILMDAMVKGKLKFWLKRH
jgi:SAM-dependent methyltransferase